MEVGPGVFSNKHSTHGICQPDSFHYFGVTLYSPESKLPKRRRVMRKYLGRIFEVRFVF
jgi:hypothetical protein